MLPGQGSCLARVCASCLSSRAFRSIPARLVHKFVHTVGTASGHLLDRGTRGLPRVDLHRLHAALSGDCARTSGRPLPCPNPLLRMKAAVPS